MAFGKVNKDANQQVGMRFFVSKGWTPMQAAAIVGNLTAESYMNPRTPRGDEGTAMGLAQWRNDRLTQFEKIIGKHCERASLEEQLRFVDWELKNTHKKAGEYLRTAPSFEAAVHAVDKHYERSAGKHLDRRIKFAREALETFNKSKGVLQTGILANGVPTKPVKLYTNEQPSLWERILTFFSK